MTILELKALLASGNFHHATYRNFGTVWEGLYIYARDPEGMRGFTLAGAFNKSLDPAELTIAEELVRGTGYSVGSFGNG